MEIELDLCIIPLGVMLLSPLFEDLCNHWVDGPQICVAELLRITALQCNMFYVHWTPAGRDMAGVVVNPLTTGWPYGDDSATQPVIVSQGEKLC